MKPMKSLSLLVALIVAALATSVAPSAAQGPQIIQKDCDTLSIVPPIVKVAFAVVNLGSIPVCSVHLYPIASGPFPPCPIFSASGPDSSWSASADAAGNAHWQKIPSVGGRCIDPFEKLELFEFTIDPPYCCYRVEYDGPDGQIFFQSIVCFQCESPTPSQRATWGSVKARYH